VSSNVVLRSAGQRFRLGSAERFGWGSQLSTRRGRWLSLAAMTLSSSWVNVDRSALLCRYRGSSRLMFSLVPRCHGSK